MRGKFAIALGLTLFAASAEAGEFRTQRWLTISAVHKEGTTVRLEGIATDQSKTVAYQECGGADSVEALETKATAFMTRSSHESRRAIYLVIRSHAAKNIGGQGRCIDAVGYEKVR